MSRIYAFIDFCAGVSASRDCHSVACRAISGSLAIQRLQVFLDRRLLHLEFLPTMATLHQLPAEIEALARLAAETQAAGLVEKLLDDMITAGICHRSRVPCSKLVVHKCNRGGYGINAYDVQDNVSDIASTQWYDKLFKGVCTDIEADEFDAVIAFNQEQVAASNGVLALVEPSKAT